jgi:hypothetical protein
VSLWLPEVMSEWIDKKTSSLLELVGCQTWTGGMKACAKTIQPAERMGQASGKLIKYDQPGREQFSIVAIFPTFEIVSRTEDSHAQADDTDSAAPAARRRARRR